MKFAIRPMTGQDLDSVMLLAAGCEEAPQWTRTAYEEIVSPPGGVLRHAFIAEQAAALAGFVVVRWVPADSEAEVETVVVAPRGPGRRHEHPPGGADIECGGARSLPAKWLCRHRNPPCSCRHHCGSADFERMLG